MAKQVDSTNIGTLLEALITKVKSFFWRKEETDNTPTSGSNNLVKSGGVYSSLQGIRQLKVLNLGGFLPSNGTQTLGTKSEAAAALNITEAQLDSLFSGEYDYVEFSMYGGFKTQVIAPILSGYMCMNMNAHYVMMPFILGFFRGLDEDADVYSYSFDSIGIKDVTVGGESVVTDATGGVAVIPAIPDVSQFITRSVNDLANYYLKSETYTKDEVASLIGAIQQTVSGLAAVARSGSYNDLLNKPNIPPADYVAMVDITSSTDGSGNVEQSAAIVSGTFAEIDAALLAQKTVLLIERNPDSTPVSYRYFRSGEHVPGSSVYFASIGGDMIPGAVSVAVWYHGDSAGPERVEMYDGTGIMDALPMGDGNAVTSIERHNLFPILIANKDKTFVDTAEQALTDAQKSQARTNIGAGTYSKPIGGIPASDIATGVIPAAPVNADWNANSGLAQILNKPTIPAAPVNADWNATEGLAKILNKPSIPAAQVPSDWDATEGVSRILNKPAIPSRYAGSPSAGGFANKAVAIPFGNVDADSTATEITATVDNFPTTLTDGVCAFIRNNVVASASGFTLNINGTGAKPVYQTLADASRVSTVFNANSTYLFVYNSTRVEGGCWDLYYGYNSNDNTIGYNLRTNGASAPPAAQKYYRYRLLFTAANGMSLVPANTSSSTSATAAKTVNQAKIDPFGVIFYYSYTSAVNAAASPNASYLWMQYNGIALGYSFNRTGEALEMTARDPVYLKCAPQSDGSAIIDADNPIVQALPTTADGKIYIFLGFAESATAITLYYWHPVYYHDGTGIKLWTANPPVTGNGEDIDQNEDGKLQFANRVYNSAQPNGMGYKILRKDATFASQVTETNTIYEIRYDFSLSANVSIPANCELRFDGGRIVGGGNTITFNNTLISGNAKFSGCEFAGTILNGEVLLSWFTEGMSSSNDYSVDHTSVLVSAMKLASKNNNGWLNLERIPICIKQTIIVTDEFGNIGMKGGNIFFVSTEDEQAMFDYQERTSYSGSYSPIIDCKFTDVGDNYNTCVIKKTRWSDTAFTYWRDIRVSGFTGYFFVTNSYIQEVTFTNISVSGAGFFSTNSDGLYDGDAGSGNIIHFLNCNCNGGELNSKTSIRAIYDLSNCIEASLNNIVCQGRIGGSNIYPAYISHTSNVTSGNRCNTVFDGFWVEYINGSGVINKIKCENVSASIEVRKSSTSVFDVVNSNVNIIIKSEGGGYAKDILEGLAIDNSSNVTLTVDSALYGELLVPSGDYDLFKSYIDRGILRVLRNSTPPYGASVTQTGVSITLTPENEADLMQEYINTITKSNVASRPFIHYLSSDNNIPVLTIEQVGTGNYYEFPFLTNYQNYLGGNIDTHVARSIWQEVVYRVTILIDVTSDNLAEVYCKSRGLTNVGGGALDTMIEPTVGMAAGESTGWIRKAFCRIFDGYSLSSGGYIVMRNCKLEIARLRIARRNVSINDDVYVDSLGTLQTMRKMPRCFYMPIESASDELSEMSNIIKGGGFTVETPKNVYKYINGHLQAMLLPTGGPAGDRPTLGVNDVGKTYYDTSLGSTIIWNGTAWVNLDGTELQWIAHSVGTLTTYLIISAHTQYEGAQNYSTNALASPYLDVSGTTKIRISVSGVASASYNYGIAFYDANKAVLAGTGLSFTNQSEDNNDVREITLPAGCSYVRTCINKNISQTITFLTWTGN